MKTSTRLLLVLSLACAALVTSATVVAGTILNQKIQFTGTTFNECTDEVILVEGSLHTTTRLSTSGDRVHEGAHVQSTGVKGTAVVSGARYVEMEVQNQQTNFSTDFVPAEFTVERTHNLTRLGEDGSSSKEMTSACT